MIDSEPRQLTQEEVRDEFLASLRGQVDYWARVERTAVDDEVGLPPMTTRSRLEGLAFSFLCMLDSVSSGLPAFEVYPAPHPDDKQDAIDNSGDNWWPQLEDRVSLHGDSMLHDLWHKDTFAICTECGLSYSVDDWTHTNPCSRRPCSGSPLR